MAMSPLDERVKEFLADKPAIKEAMKLFAISETEYSQAVANLYEPKVYTCNSTSGGVRVDGRNLEQD